MRCFDISHTSEFLIARVMRADLRVAALVAAVFLYACFGSPTPDSVGWIEGCVGALLVLAIGVGAMRDVVAGVRGGARWFYIGQVFLVVGLVCGVGGALVSGASLGAVMRDVLPFGFLFLPLFLLRLAGRAGFLRIYVGVFLCLGLVFAVRASGVAFSLLGGLPVLGDFFAGADSLYYLGNSPAVLFAALFCIGCGVEVLSRGITARALVIAALCFAGSALAVLPIVMTAQRASMAAVVVYAGLVFGVLALRAPRRMVVIGAGLVALGVFVFGGFVSAAYEGVLAKSGLVGANMRFEEWAAVWGEISGHPLRLLFGQGWGAFFASPAVADIEVRYTHSLLSVMLLKIGLVGFVLCAGYIGALFFALMRCFRGREVLVLAIVAPLMIDVFLYAAYKSLDFGLLLGLIAVVIFVDSGKSRIAS